VAAAEIMINGVVVTSAFLKADSYMIARLRGARSVIEGMVEC
jgi:hypothetical protein